MKINKEKIEAITRLPDDEMWREIVSIAKGYGFSIPEKTPSCEELQRIRSIASGGKINMVEAMKLMNNLKRGQGNG